MALAGFKVIGIVRGCDFHGAGAECEIGHIVEHDGNLTIRQRQLHIARMQARGARIQRIDGDASVAQHGFGTRGGDDDVFVETHHRVADVPQAALGLFVLHFEIRERGLAARAPVDDVIALVDESFFVEAHEGFAHGAREARIEREAFARPVATDAGALHLLDDASAIFLFPLPHAGLESITAEVALGQAFCGELPLDHDLRGDSCMIGAGQPQGVDGLSIGRSLHAAPADLGVDNGMLEHVPHVQRAGDVRRRNRERKIGFAGMRLGAIGVVLHPPLGPVRFEPLGLVDFIDFHGEIRF